MKEIIYDIEEFKAKVDKTKPLHHCAMRKSIDQHGIFIDKNGDLILPSSKPDKDASPEEKKHRCKKCGTAATW